MKRRDLLKTIAKAAKDAGVDWVLVRHGANHDVYGLDDTTIPVPRHKEINELTARAIMRECEAVLGKEWWQ